MELYETLFSKDFSFETMSISPADEEANPSSAHKIYSRALRIETTVRGRVKTMTFPVKDLIGCEYTDEGENMIEISVLPINLTNGWGCRKINNYKNTQSAKRELYSFEFNAMSRQNALNIVGTLQDLIVGKEPQSEYETLPDRRKILIFLNPFSCNAKAIFDRASLDYTFIETERGGQAHDFVSTEDLDQFESIVTVSGDGLIHEVVNGLLQREDKYYERRKIPIGALPGGSSNGFVKTLTYESGESSGVEQA